MRFHKDKRRFVRFIKLAVVVLLFWERLSLWRHRTAVRSHALALRGIQAQRRWPLTNAGVRPGYPPWRRALLLLLRRC